MYAIFVNLHPLTPMVLNILCDLGYLCFGSENSKKSLCFLSDESCSVNTVVFTVVLNGLEVGQYFVFSCKYYARLWMKESLLTNPLKSVVECKLLQLEYTLHGDGLSVLSSVHQ